MRRATHFTKDDLPRMKKIIADYHRQADQAEKKGEDAFQVFAIRNVANNWQRHVNAIENDQPTFNSHSAQKLWNLLKGNKNEK